jgi:hypothetical protein
MSLPVYVKSEVDNIVVIGVTFLSGNANHCLQAV